MRRPARNRLARRRRRWLPWSIAAAVGAIALGAIAALALGSNATYPQTSPANFARVSVGGQVGQDSPRLTVRTVAGSDLQIPAGKPTLLYFMAGWCASCLPESQALDRIERRYGDRLIVLAVDADPSDPLATLQSFRHQVGDPRYSFAQDPSAQISRAFGVAALDTTVVIDAQGKVVYRSGVPIGDAAIQAAIAKAGVQ